MFPITRRQFLATSAVSIVAAPFPALSQATLDAPNVVPISDRLTTAGQPTARALANLATLGYQSVIYLAPSTVDSAIKNERELIERQQLSFVHIPIPFGKPEEKHFTEFVTAMRRLESNKLLVHCEVNMRASCMTFLYRVIVLKVPVETAYEAVSKVWMPRFAWKPYVESMLLKNGLKFEVY